MIDKKEYIKAIEYYESSWRGLDNALYNLCQLYPDHSDRNGVHAKLWIIGRGYATGIERAVVTDGTQGGSLQRVAKHLLVNAAVVDELLLKLRAIQEPLNTEKLHVIVSVHGQLVKLLSSLTRKAMSTRSFASKYLHFHNPAVPLYDAIAAATLPALNRWNNDMSVLEPINDADQEYFWYVQRVFHLYRQISVSGLPLTVKYLDNYLLWMAEPDIDEGTSQPG